MAVPEKFSIENLRKVAIDNGGLCLSEKYICRTYKMKFRCSANHTWESTPKNILQGKWCRKCSMKKHFDEKREGNAYLLDVMKKIAEDRGGKCLDEKWINNHELMLWECKHEHRWLAKANHIKDQGTWCPTCGGTEKLTIEHMQKLAGENKGLCLSKEYVNTDTKLLWKCIEGHEWEATPNSIKYIDNWCPYCSKFKREQMCREIFEKRFNKKFPKCKPAWLLSDKYGRLELDGFCEEMKLAFEYQGIQHYEFVKFFHKDEAGLKYRKDNDEQKIKLCITAGIRVILIPYWEKDLSSFIEIECKKLGL